VRSRIEQGSVPPSWRRGLTALLPALAAASMVLAATESTVVPTRVGGIDISRCFDIIAGTSERDTARCPTILLELVEQAQQTCREAGGTLTPQSPANVWAIDVNGDGTQELSFEYEGNVACEGAWSLFDCGSLGCPKVLYEEHAGAWRAIAEISADSMESVEVLAPSAGQRYRMLRVGCGGETPCPEYWFYAWTGERYEPERLEVRSVPVDFAHSVHGLHVLHDATNVLATPAPDAIVVGHYDAGTEVAIIGTVEDADYYYVSPCNACESGFVPRKAVVIP
jgi:hypothetical protein